MSATQLIDTNNVCDTDDQITQRANSMDLDDLPKEISATTPTEPLPTQTVSTQNDKKLKP
ncbi:13031_t:CDS:2 [Gigaspora margarita]|uniref:13031_t:CDS:1 n=1 Tax=Gigaspora margarita TaxID=4874 RepID=A0ABN7W028_GIGMA|nr:13031_t:CDS:2 [Gigaspora margarita]